MGNKNTYSEEAETWSAIPDFEGLYEASTLGRVRSLSRTVTRHDGYTQSYRGQLLKCDNDHFGYPTVRLSREGRKKHLHIHIIVMCTFVGPRPEGMECCHKDGDPTNNRLDNLRYDTHAENMRDREKHGTDNAGSRHGLSKLVEREVLAIRLEYTRGGTTYKRLGIKYGVDEHTVGLIIRRQRWKHI